MSEQDQSLRRRGQRLEDLDLRETTPRDVRDEAWFQFTQEIDELLEDDRYAWAESTLSGIKETVVRMKTVSEGQRKAIANIRDGRGSNGRRYEGFHGRRW